MTDAAVATLFTRVTDPGWQMLPRISASRLIARIIIQVR
jgi:hypothetical protein